MLAKLEHVHDGRHKDDPVGLIHLVLVPQAASPAVPVLT
jgi:hypothetical protein